MTSRIGRSITLVGTARDAKAGAIVLLADGDAIYVRGLDAWPAELHQKNVTATGVLRSEKMIPSPVRSPDGAMSAGAEGDQTILDDARYGLAQQKWRHGIGAVVTVSGEARDAKAGAVVLTPDGIAYVEKLERWPADVVGQRVSATGYLLRNKWPRSPENDDSALGGEAGEMWLLTDSRWSSP